MENKREKNKRERKKNNLGDREKTEKKKLFSLSPRHTVEPKLAHLGPQLHRRRILPVDLFGERGELAGGEVAEHLAEVVEVGGGGGG